MGEVGGPGKCFVAICIAANMLTFCSQARAPSTRRKSTLPPPIVLSTSPFHSPVLPPASSTSTLAARSSLQLPIIPTILQRQSLCFACPGLRSACFVVRARRFRRFRRVSVLRDAWPFQFRALTVSLGSLACSDFSAHVFHTFRVVAIALYVHLCD